MWIHNPNLTTINGSLLRRYPPYDGLQPALLPGDPAADFAKVSPGADSDVDVDGSLELDEEGCVTGANIEVIAVELGKKPTLDLVLSCQIHVALLSKTKAGLRGFRELFFPSRVPSSIRETGRIYCSIGALKMCSESFSFPQWARWGWLYFWVVEVEIECPPVSFCFVCFCVMWSEPQ